MKALKVKFRYIVPATNVIDDVEELDKNLYQTSSNYWIITGSEEKVLDLIEENFKLHGIEYNIESV